MLGYNRAAEIPATVIKGRFSGEESDGGVGAGREHPGLRGVKGHVQDAEVMSDHMTPQNFDWDDQRVLQQIAGRQKKS